MLTVRQHITPADLFLLACSHATMHKRCASAFVDTPDGERHFMRSIELLEEAAGLFRDLVPDVDPSGISDPFDLVRLFVRSYA